MAFKEFKPSSWSIDNKTSIYVISIMLILFGISSYNKLPKEQFPDIVIPTVYIATVYPGTSPSDIENLITRPIEKQLKGVSGVKRITSNSIQNFSSIQVEFNINVNVAIAKQRVKDAVDKAKQDLPTDLKQDPNVVEVNFSDFPIMYINMSGDYELDKLKKYADDMKDKIEGLKEITRVDIVGALEREIQVNVNMYKAEAAKISIGDIEMALKYENMNIPGGTIRTGEMKRNIRIVGQFSSVDQIKNLIIKSPIGGAVYLKDIADVRDSHKEKESYARLKKGNKVGNVITLNVVKRSGENLINASDKIKGIVAEMKEKDLPEGLEVVFSGDQSTKTKTTLEDLINTIIIGFILVVIILMFFMGVTNAVFVAMSVPLSMCLAFLVMPSLGFSLNMIVLFSFLFALGIVVDDAIVVIENTHRIFDNGKIPIIQAAKMACGEVFLPVLSGTLTTISPFLPLAFWPGLMGKFMFFLPVTLIITLFASLIVAYIINPVFAVDFMKPHDHHDETVEYKRKKARKMWKQVLWTIIIAVPFYLAHNLLFANLIMVFVVLQILYHYVLEGWIGKFQTKALPNLMNSYEKLLRWTLKGKRPYGLLVATFGLLILSFVVLGIRKPQVVFFPKGDPNFIYTYIVLPIGTDQTITDSVAQVVEKKIYGIVGNNNPIVESIVTNVALGARDPSDPDRSVAPHRAKVGISFVEFGKRNGASTRDYLDKIRAELKGMPGVEIMVDQEQAGPPTGKPINIEITGDDLKELIANSKKLKVFIDSLAIPGIEELKTDFIDQMPELIVDIDRERASREGISSAQIGLAVKNAVMGNEATKYREFEDEYPVQIRFNETQRTSIEKLMNLKVTYRDMAMGGMIRQVPLSSVAKFHYQNSYGGIKRKNLKRVINLQSNVLTGYTPNEIIAKIDKALPSFKKSDNVEVKFTGEQEDQKETSDFLGTAMLLSIGLIFLILVTQFNSTSKPMIILVEILFSVIGVFLGVAIFNMQMVIVMTGMGIIALAGIVVRNGILVVEFIDVLKERGDMESVEHGLTPKKMRTREAIIKGGKTRITPVLLTSTATILGLIPLAVGLNINFEGLLAHGHPHIFFGGDNVAFWGPLSWTMIFGLSFATFLTLVLVPSMYLINHRTKIRFTRWRIRRKIANE